VSLGLGVAIGGLLSAVLAPRRALLALVAAAAAAGAAALGYFAIDGWPEAIGGGVGGAVGALAAGAAVTGALGRGGTRAGTTVLVAVATVLLAGLAFVPALGYLEAAVLPLLAARARRRRPARHAGLRSLARD
jgi:hypothetical protein